MVTIKQIQAREIIDSRGNPTVECCLTLSDGHSTIASVPSGASVGSQEAYELRDRDPQRYGGLGVLKAVANVEQIISPALMGMVPELTTIDNYLMVLDGTPNKAKLGANAILAVSIAVARAQAYVQRQELYAFFADYFQVKPLMPRCMFNLLNGGLHVQGGVAFQEFMVMPQVDEVTVAVQMASDIYHTLKELLHVRGYVTTIGDEGGFAPALTDTGFDREWHMLELLMMAIEKAGYKSGLEVKLCIDSAATSFYDQDCQSYLVGGQLVKTEDLITCYQKIVTSFPIFMLEDGLSEYDMHGWQALTQVLGNQVCLVGDDLFVTNLENIKAGVEQHIANGVLIKPNQIGTLTQAAQAIHYAQLNHYKTVVSHRSGETGDAFIADLAVGLSAGYIKAGAPARGERVAKYNRLMYIENFK